MKNAKRLLAVLLVLTMVISMAPAALAGNFNRTETWSDDLFTDVSASDWFYGVVKGAYELKLMDGCGDGIFAPRRQITLAETITIAARIHSIYATGQSAFEQGEPWYQVYADYAIANGIITAEPGDMNKQATRLEFARILAKAMPAEALPAINTVDDGAIPDVAADEAVYMLYRAGVLTGNDDAGSFSPGTTIIRSEVAAIIARMADPALREEITLTKQSGGSTQQTSRPGGQTPSAPPVSEPGTDADTAPETALDENNALTVPFDVAYPEYFEEGGVLYSGEQILIKLTAAPDTDQQEALTAAGISGMDEIMTTADAVWYKAYVSGSVKDAMEAVRALDFVLLAEYDYVYETETIIECGPDDLDDDIKGNDHYDKQWYLRSCGLHKGLGHLKNPHKRPHYDEEAGESGVEEGENTEGAEAGEGIVVAVIDTGVDYTHEDLKDNIWVNVNEIPDDGIDNDKNGYIDDYYGYNAVAGKGSAMDDNGHGTHVAGIIAAANNNIGIVGIAYNAKIMPIKAGMASGYFNQSDIAEAIIYACEHGADVINMSFGGSASTIMVQDALEDAYTHSVLVAAAGNDGLPNEPTDHYLPIPNYPASLTYVLGVMSVDENGVESSFTNWDRTGYNNPEYELYAPGDQMISTIPGNRYATWSGTSMAAPVVSAAAALLRSEFRDRNTYPTKFIYGQLCSTSGISATCFDPEDHEVNGGPHNLPQIVDVYSALTKMPTPEVSVYECDIFDTAGIKNNPKNNGDGVIDAGETFAIGFYLRNRWGKSANTTVKVDTLSQAGIPDPYITIHNDTVNIGSVGTYSTKDFGRIVENDQFVAWENPIYITVSPDCPNDYIFELNVSVTCRNGLDSGDKTTYGSDAIVTYNVRRGILLPSIIEEDMTLTADNYYIIPNSTLIAADATVTVEPGTSIQFWSDDADDPYADSYMAYLKVDGRFICEGTPENPIKIFPGERMNSYRVEIKRQNNGIVELYNTDVVNPYLTINYAEGCAFSQNYLNEPLYYRNLSGSNVYNYYDEGQVSATKIVDCSYYKLGGYKFQVYPFLALGNHYGCVFIDSGMDLKNDNRQGIIGSTSDSTYEDCLFYGNNNYLNNTSGIVSDLIIGSSSHFSGTLYTDRSTGTTYLTSAYNRAYDLLAEELGGYLLSINTPEEYDFIYNNISHLSSGARTIGLIYDHSSGEARWADGSEVGSFIEYTVGDSPYYGACIDYWGAIEVATNRCGSAIYEFPARYVDEIELDNYSVLMDTQSSGRQINATAKPGSIADAVLVYKSMNESVAKVSETGFITPVGAGETEIRVYSPDMAVYNHLTVTVKAPVALESIELGEDFLLPVGESSQLTPVLTPANTTRSYLVFTSSNENVATVSKTGVVTALGEGRATITAKNPDSGISHSITVEGYIPVTSVEFADPMAVLPLAGKSSLADLGVSVYPEDATYPELIWESSNPEILEVAADGSLTKHSLGTATLRATNEISGLYADIAVCISEADPNVTVVQMSTFSGNYGGPYTVALLSDGTLWRWGDNVLWPEQMGYWDGAASQKTFTPFTNIRQFAIASYNTSGFAFKLLTVDNSGTMNAYWMSSGIYVEDAHWEPYNSFIGGSPISGVTRVDGGSSAYYLLDDGTVWAMGDNNYGQLGIGSKTSYKTFVQMQGLDGIKIVDIAADNYNAYMLADNGDLYYCGNGADTLPKLLTEDVKSISITAGSTPAVIIEYEYSVQNGKYSSCKMDKLDNAILYTSTHSSYQNSSYYNFVYLTEEGTVWGKTPGGQSYGNSYGELGLGHNKAVYDYTCMERITNATNLFIVGNTTYIQIADGKLYGTGYNSNGEINPLLPGHQYVPQRVYFGLVSEPAPALESSNLSGDEASGYTLNEPTLILDYDQALIAGETYAAATLKDSSGRTVGMHRSIHLDKFALTPAAGFIPGETYTLTLPANAFSNVFFATSEALSYTFTAGEGAASGGITSGGGDSAELPEQVINETVADPELMAEREYITLEMLQTTFTEINVHSDFYNNAIINRLDLLDGVTKWLRITGQNSSSLQTAPLGHNYWGTTNETLIGYQIVDFDDFQTLYNLDHSGYLTTAPETVWPFAVNAGLINASGEEVDVIGNELVTFFVEFNRDMDTSIPLSVRFGSAYPYGDYEIEGEWVSARRWEGTTTLTTIIEAGYQYWSIENGCAADNPALTLFDDWGRFMFEIDTSDALAMTLHGEATNEGVALTWEQDDFDTLMGYNIYRADKDEDAYYQKLNTSVIPFGTESFFDDTVAPGQVYYYIFTVVKTDFSESEPSGKIRILSKDTMSPTLYHTPVYSAYAGSNVVINATASDNLQLASVKLFYRVAGTSAWSEVTMSKLNDKYSAVISGDKVTTAGIEYYVAASDGVNTEYRGSTAEPYTIVVQENPGEQMLGDVNGDGRISIADALRVLRAINNKVVLTSEEFTRADLDGSGVLTAAEALTILKYANGEIGSLKMN